MRSWGKLGTSHTHTHICMINFPTRDFKSRPLEYHAQAVNWYRLHYRRLWKKDGYPRRAFYWVTFSLWVCVPVAFLHCNVPHHDYADFHKIRSGNYCTIFAANTSCQNEFILFTHVDDGHRHYIRSDWITDTNLPLKGLGKIQSAMVSVLLYLSMPCSCVWIFRRSCCVCHQDWWTFLPDFAASKPLKGKFLSYVTDNVKNITKFNSVHLFLIAFMRNIGASSLKSISAGL
jgi:hypothetical protein